MSASTRNPSTHSILREPFRSCAPNVWYKLQYWAILLVKCIQQDSVQISGGPPVRRRRPFVTSHIIFTVQAYWLFEQILPLLWLFYDQWLTRIHLRCRCHLIQLTRRYSRHKVHLNPRNDSQTCSMYQSTEFSIRMRHSIYIRVSKYIFVLCIECLLRTNRRSHIDARRDGSAYDPTSNKLYDPKLPRAITIVSIVFIQLISNVYSRDHHCQRTA